MAKQQGQLGLRDFGFKGAKSSTEVFESLLSHRKDGSNSSFTKSAIISLVKKINGEELDVLHKAVRTNGEQTGKCVPIPRTRDGRLQVEDKKVYPHFIYARIWRWPDLDNKQQLKAKQLCTYPYDRNLDKVCVNPYHYERVGSPVIVFESLLSHRKDGSNSSFTKSAIISLVKKINGEELDVLHKAVRTNGEQTGKCVPIPRTRDGRLQVEDKKVYPHFIYARIWRWPDLDNKQQLKAKQLCTYPYDRNLDKVCVNPYHYERVGSPVIVFESLLSHRKDGSNSSFTKSAIISLVKKINGEELDVLHKAVRTNGEQTGKCVPIPRTRDGRLQVEDKKVYPHFIYARIWRWPDLDNKQQLKAKQLCTYPYDRNLDKVCVNPYHYERVGSPVIVFESLLSHRKDGSNSSFTKSAIISLVKKINGEELDVLHKAVRTNGEQTGKCVPIPRTRDGRLQV